MMATATVEIWYRPTVVDHKICLLVFLEYSIDEYIYIYNVHIAGVNIYHVSNVSENTV